MGFKHEGKHGDLVGGKGHAAGCEGAWVGKMDWLREGLLGREMECARGWSPKCRAKGGRSDKHGDRRPGPGAVFRVERFCDCGWATGTRSRCCAASAVRATTGRPSLRTGSGRSRPFGVENEE